MELVRTWKESDLGRGTHQLETAKRGTCQNTERTRPSKGHLPTGDGRGRDLSEHGKKATSGRHPLPGDSIGGTSSEDKKKATERGAPTSWRWQRKRLVRARNVTDRAMGHSPTEDGRGRNILGRGKKVTEQRALTPCKWKREVIFRTPKESNRTRETHRLETSEGEACHDQE